MFFVKSVNEISIYGIEKMNSVNFTKFLSTVGFMTRFREISWQNFHVVRIYFDSMDSSSSDDDDQIVLQAFAAAHAVIKNNNEIMKLCFYDSDSDSDDNDKRWGGSKVGKKGNKKRNFDAANQKLIKHYFSGDSSTYNEIDFERRFGVPRQVFNVVYNAIYGEGIFVRKYDAYKKGGIHPLVRTVACFRKLVYGDACDRLDESLEISESTLHETFREFCIVVTEKFSATYLNRCPDENDKIRCLKKMKERGFPGCFASWDCKHFDWEMCPVRLAGQHLSTYLVVFFVAEFSIFFHFVLSFNQTGTGKNR